MRPILTFIFCLLLAIEAYGEDRIKIGVSLPLSGDAATYGTDIKNGLLFANQRIADNKYELVIEDDKCSDREAVSVAQKLVSIDKVQYALGFGCSGALLAAAPVYEKGKVLVIASATGAPAISQAGDYIFRTIPSLNVAAQKLFEHASAKYKKVGILSEETAYCQGLAAAFLKAAEGNPLSIISESFLPNTADFRTLLTKFKNKGAQALFVNPQSEAGLVTIFKQVRALNWEVPIYAAYYPGSPAFLNVFGKRADGIVYADLPFNEQLLNSKGIEVYKDFTEEYGEPKSGEFNITLTYAALNALHQAIENGGSAKDFLYKNNFAGIIDDYSFDENGDVVSDKITFVLKTIKDGKPAPLANTL